MHRVPLNSASTDFRSCYFALLELKNALQDKTALLPSKHPAVHGQSAQHFCNFSELLSTFTETTPLTQTKIWLCLWKNHH